MSNFSKSLILVTGASGYLASHVVNTLLKDGYRVRGTVRSLKDEKKVRPLRDLAKNGEHLELVEADLLNADSWKHAVKDCEVVMHVASPLPIETPSDEQLVLGPAINGTLNVLNASYEANVNRVVVTSSGLAVMGSDYQNGRTYGEKDWGDENTKAVYCKSKILAEKAAWNFVAEKQKENKKKFELVVINPVLILGPILHDTIGTSMNRFLSVLGNKVEKIPNMYFPTCDVRDVARAHVLAAFNDEAVGKRIIIGSETNFIHMSRWAEILQKEFGPHGYKIPTEVDLSTPPRGEGTCLDLSNMENILRLKPTFFESTIIDMANSLIQRGFLN
jgi:nucleoside-diphosphate-sugar epimerase